MLRPASRRRLVIGAALAIALSVSGPACGSSKDPVAAPDPAVAVEGIAQEVLDDWAFVLAEQPGDGDELLIIDARPSRVQLGEKVRVTGALRRFTKLKASETHGRQLDLETFARFEGRTYVEAQLVERRAGSTGS